VNLSRRQILRGAFGASLALPFLPSLFGAEREARAAYTTRKFFVSMSTEHGGAWGKNMFPADATLTDKRTYAGFEIRRGALAAAKSAGKASLCPILTGADGKLTDTLIAKMNVLRGLDIPFYIGHNTGGALGNYARNDGNGADGQAAQQTPMPTIDQVMAWSPNFYADLGSIRERSIIAAGNVSFDFSNPQARTGPIQAIASSYDSSELFKRIFVSNDPTGRKPIADLVLEDYKRTRNASGLSKEDQRRLDDHVQRISELQRRLNVRATCSTVKQPTSKSTDYMTKPSYGIDPAFQDTAWQLMNDVIVAGFTCGTSRIAVTRPAVTFSNYSGDWHQDVAHQAHLPDGAKQAVLAASYQTFFENVFLDLVAKLDAVDDGTGRTLLDSALVVWSQECGAYTHEAQSLPIVTAGTAGGFFKTGQYCDYRNLYQQRNRGGYQGSTEITHAGLLQSQWLGSVLQSMGIERSEYEKPNVGGYGLEFIAPDSTSAYPAAVVNARKDILPFLT
jgi:hypothetical protein